MALGSSVVPEEVRGSGLALLGTVTSVARLLASHRLRRAVDRLGHRTPRSPASPRRSWPRRARRACVLAPQPGAGACLGPSARRRSSASLVAALRARRRASPSTLGVARQRERRRRRLGPAPPRPCPRPRRARARRSLFRSLAHRRRQARDRAGGAARPSRPARAPLRCDRVVLRRRARALPGARRRLRRRLPAPRSSARPAGAARRSASPASRAARGSRPTAATAR